MGPLVSHLNDFGEAEEATGIVNLALCEHRVGGGWRSFPSFSVSGGIMEDGELLLGDLLTADVGIGSQSGWNYREDLRETILRDLINGTLDARLEDLGKNC